MSCSNVAGMPCARRTLIAYSRLEHDDSSMVTWSAAVILSFTMTPRIRAQYPDMAVAAFA